MIVPLLLCLRYLTSVTILSRPFPDENGVQSKHWNVVRDGDFACAEKGVICFMVHFLGVQVTQSVEDMSDREQKLLEVLILHQCAHATYRLLGEPARIRPVQTDDAQIAFHHLICFDQPIYPTDAASLSATIIRNMESALKMCDLTHMTVRVYPGQEESGYIIDSVALN